MTIETETKNFYIKKGSKKIMNKNITLQTRQELEKLFQKIVLLKANLDIESDEYLYYKEMRDSIEMVLDRPVPLKKEIK